MANTFTVTAVPPILNPQAIGHLKCYLVDIASSGTYTTGGDTLPPAKFGLKKILAFIPCGLMQAVGGTTANIASYDYTNEKLQLFESGAANAAPAEKTSGEAVIASSTLRALVCGL